MQFAERSRLGEEEEEAEEEEEEDEEEEEEEDLDWHSTDAVGLLRNTNYYYK